MGIGQILEDMAVHVDYVAPMVYPSHYRKGEYGIENRMRRRVQRSAEASAMHRQGLHRCSRSEDNPMASDFSWPYVYGAR